MARRPAPPPPQPPSPVSSGDEGSSSGDDGSSSGDEDQEQARYRFQKKPSTASPSETTKSPAATAAVAADEITSEGEDDEEGSDEEEEEGMEEMVKDKEEEEGSSEEEEVEANNQANNNQPAQVSQKAPPPPESSSEPDSGSSESDDEAPLPTALATASRPSRTKDLSIKPISSRPMDGSTAKPPPSPPPHGKNPLKNNGEVRDRSKVKDEPVSQKKQMFQRLWSIQDELTLLRGMVDYRDKRGILPTHSQDMAGFLDFIKGSLGVEVTKNQLGDKIRKLKSKFTTATSRKNGADLIFSNSHNKAVYEMSKTIWGSENTAPAKLIEEEAELTAESESDDSARDVKVEHGNNHLMFPCLSEFTMKMDDGTPYGFGIKRSFELVNPGKAALLETKLKKLKLKKMRMQLREMDLIKDSVKLVVDSLATLE